MAGLLSALVAIAGLSSPAPSASAAASDPLFIFVPIPECDPFKEGPCPSPKPPPFGTLNGPCGLEVDSEGNFYVSDYYRHNVDVFVPNGYGPPPQDGRDFFITQLTKIDPLDGPCGLALDAADNLYVNSYHRSVIRYGSKAAFGTGTVIAGAGVDDTHPTGVAVDPATGNVYVDVRTHIAVYDSSGAPVMDGAEPLRIGLGSLEDGYGVAYSQFPGTLGRLYVADAATDTVKIYDPALDTDEPVAEIDGAATPNGEFVSLRDSALAVDRVSGELYVVDNLEPEYAEQPDGIVYVFAADGSYKGHLKYLIRDALPPGLAVDNSAMPTQGRVYVTSSNTVPGAVYAYPPGAATTGTPKPTGWVVNPSAPACSAPSNCNQDEQWRTSVRSRFAAVSLLGTLLTFAVPSLAQGESQKIGNMLLDVSAKLSPNKLPRDRLAGTGVSIGWKISSTDGTEPPKLKTIKIEINRNGILDATGLPVCPYGKIQPASTSRALSNCRSSLVGKGSFSAQVGLEGQERYVAHGKMLVFNGEEKGRPVLYGQLYSGYPFPNSFVIVFKIDRRKHGSYGTTLSATLPANLRAWGNLTETQMNLSRNYSYKGKKRSFISASCATPKGVGITVFKLARTSFAFTGGTNATTTLTETCKVRG